MWISLKKYDFMFNRKISEEKNQRINRMELDNVCVKYKIHLFSNYTTF